VDIQALFYDLEPDYECRDMQRSMAHHRDLNVPHQLNATATIEFENNEETIETNLRIACLTKAISGRPKEHEELDRERSRLYSKKAKRLLAWKKEFIKQWWEKSYAEYVSGNDFSERDKTPLFDIYKKYLPERARLSERIFYQATLDSDFGQQCLEDMVTLCKPTTERVVYYPGMTPKEGRCPICPKSMKE
jgi:hypothetical protein